jgi:hypothetical protein
MFLSLIASSASLFLDVGGESSSSELRLKCSASEQSGLLEIGLSHAFGNATWLLGRKKHVLTAVTLYVRQRSALSETALNRLALNDEKIGTLGFFPGSESRDDLPGRDASLEAYVFVTDEIFDRLIRSIQAGRKPDSIHVDLGGGDSLEYGWEPDGSRMVWKIDKPTSPAYIKVAGMQFNVPLLA